MAHAERNYLAVGWPECLSFLDGGTGVHLSVPLGTGAGPSFFVSEQRYEEVTGGPLPIWEALYVAVPFPESQSYMGWHPGKVSPVMDMAGIREHGHGACFVEAGLYWEVRLGHLRKDDNGTPNLVELFHRESRTDAPVSDDLTESLKAYYNGANMMQRAAINHVFVVLCGWSYEDLLEMETQENGGDNPSPIP